MFILRLSTEKQIQKTKETPEFINTGAVLGLPIFSSPSGRYPELSGVSPRAASSPPPPGCQCQDRVTCTHPTSQPQHQEHSSPLPLHWALSTIKTASQVMTSNSQSSHSTSYTCLTALPCYDLPCAAHTEGRGWLDPLEDFSSQSKMSICN